MMTHTGWIANLSDGETYFEGTPQPGERTPWQQFLTNIEKDGHKITGLRLQRGGVNLHALPHKQTLGYYQAYELHKALSTQADRRYQGIGSVIKLEGINVVICWVDDQGNVWQDVRPLDSEIIHTTMR